MYFLLINENLNIESRIIDPGRSKHDLLLSFSIRGVMTENI